MNPLLGLKSLGQSVWLDDLHRRLLIDGSMAQMIERDGLAGVTSNPAILAAAITQHEEYVPALAALRPATRTGLELYESLVLEDVRRAADAFRAVFERSGGRDGFVSLEVSPHLARDSQATVAQARRLWESIDRPNAMIKVPGTSAGLEAVALLTAAGVNVNVTLLFSVARYRAVAAAFQSGLEQRLRRGENLRSVASVASFFLSRIDTHVDRLLDETKQEGRDEVRPLRGCAATASAFCAYQAFRESVRSERWQALAQRGARPQRLLWASTSTKNPAYSDIKYVEDLIAPETVNTMPLETLSAYRDHGHPQPRLEAYRERAQATVDGLAARGIDLETVAEQLEREGLRKFVEPFERVLEWLEARRKPNGPLA